MSSAHKRFDILYLHCR